MAVPLGLSHSGINKPRPNLTKRPSQPLAGSKEQRKIVPLSKRASKTSFDRLSADEKMAILNERSKKLNDFLHNAQTVQDARTGKSNDPMGRRESHTAANSSQQGRINGDDVDDPALDGTFEETIKADE